MAFISYAQNFEDIMLWRALKHVERGFYIDVGAYSPEIDSVTRAFSERGWRGINLEPNPHYLAELTSHRPHDINLGIAVSDAVGRVELTLVADTGLATVDPAIAQSHMEAGRPLDRIEVPTRTLALIWDEHVPAGQSVHFLKVDVEGHEAAVLRGADWTRHRPWIVVVEATIPNTQISTHDEWEELLTRAGYMLVYWDGLNRFYIAPEHAALAENFTAPPNFFDDFVLQDQVRDKEHAARLSLTVSTLEGTLSQRVEAAVAVERQIAAVERQITDISRALAALSQDGRAQGHLVNLMLNEVLHSRERLDYFIDRPMWQGLLLGPSGRPRRPFRLLFFHASGKPRGLFRRWIVHRDGRPRGMFRQWMSSAAYRSLRYPAAREALLDTDVATDVSQRGQYFLKRLMAGKSRDVKG